MAKARPQIFSCTVGYHPHVASNFDSTALESVRKLAAEDSVVAIGETGLDFNHNFSSKESQLQAFEQQLQLAIETGKPLFLHQRDAHNEFFELLKAYRDQIVGGVVHCFTDSEKALQDYLALDLYIGVTGWICDERRGQELQSLVGKIPSNRLLIETDAPYLLPRTLSPKPKTRRNEPRYLLEVVNAVAQHSGRSVEQVAAETHKNATDLFNIRR
jgi:TatD DNase family protein